MDDKEFNEYTKSILFILITQVRDELWNTRNNLKVKDGKSIYTKKYNSYKYSLYINNISITLELQVGIKENRFVYQKENSNILIWISKDSNYSNYISVKNDTVTYRGTQDYWVKILRIIEDECLRLKLKYC